MQHVLSEVQIVPIRQQDGLVAFASLVLDGDVYLGGIGIHTRPEGGYRLTYPTRKAGMMSYPVFNPINRAIAQMLEQEVVSRYEEVTKPYDRHNRPNT